MHLAVNPPVLPMLAKPVHALPDGERWLFEPKWDGFRALVFRDADELFIQSRDGKPLGRVCLGLCRDRSGREGCRTESPRRNRARKRHGIAGAKHGRHSQCTRRCRSHLYGHHAGAAAGATGDRPRQPVRCVGHGAGEGGDARRFVKPRADFGKFLRHRIEARSVRSPRTTSAPSRRRATARSSSRRTRARTLRPLASSIAVRLRPMAPTAPAAPVTRIGQSGVDYIIMSLA